MQRRKLGSQGLEVSAQGLGCMGMTHAYGAGDETSGLDTIHRALELGVTFLDTAEIYGPYLRAGKVRYIGLSEAAPETIRRAHATHPLSAVQSEYSLWTRDPEDAVIPTLRQLGISLVAYSPLGRGFLTGQIRSIDDLAQGDWRRTNPRFQDEALAQNLQLADRVVALADQLAITPAQLALAWVMAKGVDIVPIPGTKRRSYLEDNVEAAELELSDQAIAALDDAVAPGAARGGRYADRDMELLNQ